MNDLDQLAVLDPSRGREPSEMEWARSRASIDRMLNGVPEHRPQTAWRRVGVTAAAAVAVGAVGAVAVPALLPGAAEEAIAAWTPAPGSLTGEQVMPQARECAGDDPVVPDDVLLAEQRGLATLLILRKDDGTVVECLNAGDSSTMASMALVEESRIKVPAQGAVDLETMSSLGDGDGQWSNIVGLTGAGVTGVDVRLDSGKVLQASVRNGWWAAWWPGAEGGEVDTLTVVVHTADGSTSHRPSTLG
ncbi:hypothetical protein AB0M02_20915 [Actinoplanes sp. NPDC051861]|uniref:hypothetical protein n=1 Tax=Actinoplanes sp. NPDC051861 TaxID=3155170 RepID=UPI0034283BB4